MNSYTRDEVGIELASSFFVSSAHQLHPRLSPHPELVGGFFVMEL
jgi:hydrogenase maturation factor HypE